MAFQIYHLAQEQMKSRLWSQLPTDVITKIMEHASDTRARKNWLKAAFGNITLYRQAVRVYIATLFSFTKTYYVDQPQKRSGTAKMR